MRRHLRRSLWLLLAGLVLAPGSAQAVLTIRITQGIEGAVPIAVVPFGWDGSGPSAPQDVAGIVASDLRRSGLFDPVPFEDLPGRPHEAADVRYTDWRLLGTNSLVIGNVTRQPSGTYRVQFRLFDVYKATQLTGFQFDVRESDLRRTAHHISDIVYEQLTGERGAFDTRIAYVSEWSVAGGDKRYALNIADSDGYNSRAILESTQPVLSPAWSPEGGRLAYVSLEGKRAHVFVQDLSTGKREEVAAFPGLNGAPAFAPDGKRLAITLSKDGNPEIYVLYLGSGRLMRLTNNSAIDTEAEWAPDGNSIVFTSDRGGSPQLYRVAAQGGEVKRITFEGSYNAGAAFSPDGKQLAMVHSNGGGFQIALLDLENNALRLLTDGRLDESPSFAPNGSMILYATTDNEGGALAAVSTDGRVRQRLAEQTGAVREPAWSPFRTEP